MIKLNISRPSKSIFRASHRMNSLCPRIFALRSECIKIPSRLKVGDLVLLVGLRMCIHTSKRRMNIHNIKHATLRDKTVSVASNNLEESTELNPECSPTCVTDNDNYAVITFTIRDTMKNKDH